MRYGSEEENEEVDHNHKPRFKQCVEESIMYVHASRVRS